MANRIKISTETANEVRRVLAKARAELAQKRAILKEQNKLADEMKNITPKKLKEAQARVMAKNKAKRK